MTEEIIQDELPIKGKKKNKDEKREDEVENAEHEGLNEQMLIEHELITKLKTIDNIEIGKHHTPTWYYSPYPEG